MYANTLETIALPTPFPYQWNGNFCMREIDYFILVEDIIHKGHVISDM